MLTIDQTINITYNYPIIFNLILYPDYSSSTNNLTYNFLIKYYIFWVRSILKKKKSEMVDFIEKWVKMSILVSKATAGMQMQAFPVIPIPTSTSMRSISHSSPFRLLSAASITTLLKACKKREHLEQVHACIIHRGLEQDHFLVFLFISRAHIIDPKY